MSQNKIELAEFIAHLRSELARALVEGEQKAIKFDCGPLELELDVKVDRTREAGGRIRFWVVDADATLNQETRHSQRIKMKLTPRTADSPSEQLQISGETVAGER